MKAKKRKFSLAIEGTSVYYSRDLVSMVTVVQR